MFSCAAEYTLDRRDLIIRCQKSIAPITVLSIDHTFNVAKRTQVHNPENGHFVPSEANSFLILMGANGQVMDYKETKYVVDIYDIISYYL